MARTVDAERGGKPLTLCFICSDALGPKQPDVQPVLGTLGRYDLKKEELVLLSRDGKAEDGSFRHPAGDAEEFRDEAEAR